MCKPTDLHTQIEAFPDGEKSTNERYRTQFGVLAVATGAGALGLERLAGGLLATVK